MIFDTLFGTDGAFQASPQMAAGMTSDNDGKLVRIALRDGLKFHDGTPVLARDCVASIQRWSKRDTFGRTLMAATDELTADRRQDHPVSSQTPVSAAARRTGQVAHQLPRHDARAAGEDRPVHSGHRDGRQRPVPLQRARSAWPARCWCMSASPATSRVPTASPTGPPARKSRISIGSNGMSSPIRAPPGRAAEGRGRLVGKSRPTTCSTRCARSAGVKVAIQDPTGLMGCMRLNHLTAPFRNPAIRRALLKAIDQRDFCLASSGDDPAMWHVPTGLFCSGQPVRDRGRAGVSSPANATTTRAARNRRGGLSGREDRHSRPHRFPVAESDGRCLRRRIPQDRTQCRLPGDGLGHAWCSAAPKRNRSRKAAGAFSTRSGRGLDQFNPVGHVFMRGMGTEAGAAPGWPSSPRIEELRQLWLDAPDLAAQRSLARRPAVPGVDRCALCAVGSGTGRHRLSRQPHRRAERVSCCSGMSARRDIDGAKFRPGDAHF